MPRASEPVGKALITRVSSPLPLQVVVAPGGICWWLSRFTHFADTGAAIGSTLFVPPESSGAEVVAPVQAVCGGKRWTAIPARSQLAFAARCTEDFVPDEAPVPVIDAIGEGLDVTAFERRYPGGGRPACHPPLLAKLVIHGLCMGVLSARELSRRLDRDLHFMWLAYELRVDYEVLSDFRRRFHDEIRGLAARLPSALSGRSRRSWACGNT